MANSDNDLRKLIDNMETPEDVAEVQGILGSRTRVSAAVTLFLTERLMEMSTTSPVSDHQGPLGEELEVTAGGGAVTVLRYTSVYFQVRQEGLEPIAVNQSPEGEWDIHLQAMPGMAFDRPVQRDGTLVLPVIPAQERAENHDWIIGGLWCRFRKVIGGREFIESYHALVGNNKNEGWDTFSVSLAGAGQHQSYMDVAPAEFELIAEALSYVWSWNRQENIELVVGDTGCPVDIPLTRHVSRAQKATKMVVRKGGNFDSFQSSKKNERAQGPQRSRRRSWSMER